MARKPSLSLPVPAPPVVREQPAYIPDSRRGKGPVTVWLDTAKRQEFRLALVRAEASAQSVLEEMVDEWMRRAGARMPGDHR